MRENSQVVSIKANAKVFHIMYKDGSGEHEAEAPVLINATGPWNDEVNNQYQLPHNYRINKVSGIHIVINKNQFGIVCFCKPIISDTWGRTDVP